MMLSIFFHNSKMVGMGGAYTGRTVGDALGTGIVDSSDWTTAGCRRARDCAYSLDEGVVAVRGRDPKNVRPGETSTLVVLWKSGERRRAAKRDCGSKLRKIGQSFWNYMNYKQHKKPRRYMTPRSDPLTDSSLWWDSHWDPAPASVSNSSTSECTLSSSISKSRFTSKSGGKVDAAADCALFDFSKSPDGISETRLLKVTDPKLDAWSPDIGVPRFWGCPGSRITWLCSRWPRACSCWCNSWRCLANRLKIWKGS